ncbi:hypothetical protein WG68_02450 [Arsukibacterium ikkense]|uniref:HPt domain-containing protein n=1 Tax=Arsukibacterium ikkense TaxID=336831 RepID=A0A0M2VB27_9GAMM|nr:Hpt domain-containing protein [Arsukibacterium ikkense]KKO46825.1 hypothetical protein WG68_02450 [Arsukibacterium ikkense]
MNKPASLVVLDLAILIDMYGDDSADTICPALSRFRSEASKYINQLQHAVVQQDHAEIARLTHSLKSMAGLIGACQLMEWSQLVEQAAKQRDQTMLANHLPELTTIWAALQTELASSLLLYGSADA